MNYEIEMQGIDGGWYAARRSHDGTVLVEFDYARLTADQAVQFGRRLTGSPITLTPQEARVIADAYLTGNVDDLDAAGSIITRIADEADAVLTGDELPARKEPS